MRYFILLVVALSIVSCHHSTDADDSSKTEVFFVKYDSNKVVKYYAGVKIVDDKLCPWVQVTVQDSIDSNPSVGSFVYILLSDYSYDNKNYEDYNHVDRSGATYETYWLPQDSDYHNIFLRVCCIRVLNPKWDEERDTLITVGIRFGKKIIF
jgi:hypothetical protein